MRTALIHILSWLGLGSYLFIINYDNYREHYEPDFIVYKQIITMIVLVIPFYVNYFFLTPFTLIKKKKYLLFFLGALLIIGLDSILNVGFLHMMDLYLNNNFYSEQASWANLVTAFTTPILFLAVSVGLRLSKEYYKNMRRQLHLEHQIAEAELQMLKSQINPHFLFNSLNNIYRLTQKKSDNAPDAVLKLSEMMRYVLHEANQKKVTLRNELEQLNNFISLQKLRMVDPSKVNYIAEYEGELTMAPLLLIPLLENAFKHSDLTKQSAPITIDVEIKGSQLTFTVVNGIDEIEKHEHSGIGLKNLKRRLVLLYENKHELKLEQKEGKFFAKLELELGND